MISPRKLLTETTG